MSIGTGFENLVNYEECKTMSHDFRKHKMFENLVNYEECKTIPTNKKSGSKFENLVNYEECKTRMKLLTGR